jgi:putative glutamine amidotransferase
MKPLIGITGAAYYNRDHPYEPISYGQIYQYSDAISKAGGVPVILPIAKNKQETKEIFERLNGILFAGGNDIAPGRYGEEIRTAYDIDEQRDKHEFELMRLALESHIPVLAICRGMQLLNVFRGGTLYQDISQEIPSAKNHIGYVDVSHDPAYLTHTLTIMPDSQLSKILGKTEIKSNSRHHQAVKEVGKGLIVNAYSEDGIIEGIEDGNEKFVIGVEPHPESLVEKAQPQWKPLFDAFVAAAEKS